MVTVENIKERLERGYTVTLYGTRELVHEQMEKDIKYLLSLKSYTEEDMIKFASFAKNYATPRIVKEAFKKFNEL